MSLEHPVERRAVEERRLAVLLDTAPKGQPCPEGRAVEALVRLTLARSAVAAAAQWPCVSVHSWPHHREGYSHQAPSLAAYWAEADWYHL